MKKQDEYKIGGAANEFVNKYKAELSPIKKAELEAMLKDFAIKQVNLFAIHSVSGCPFEAYAVFCIECDRQGIKPIKHKDFLALG